MTNRGELDKIQKGLDKSVEAFKKTRTAISGKESEDTNIVASKRRRSIIGTFLVVILIGIAYFYFYTERAGDRIDERRFRTLADVENHIRQKEKGYLQALESINIDKALIKIIAKNPKKTKITYNDLQQEGIDNPVAANLILLKDTTGNDNPDHYYLKNIPMPLTGKLAKSVGSKQVTFKLYVRLSSFMGELVPEGIFDHILILEDEADSSLRSLYLSLTNRLIIEDTVVDSLFTRSTAFKTGGIKEMLIDGKKYRMYIHVAANEQLSISKRKIICGLIQNSSYQSLKRQVNIWLVIILSILSIVAIICIPLLKIVLINFFEQIDISDVVLSGLSLILGAPLVLLIFLSVFEYANYFFYEQPVGLEKLGNGIEKVIYSEVDSGLSQLNHLQKYHDKLRRDTSGVGKLCPQQYSDNSHCADFNEYYGIEENGEISFVYYYYGGYINPTLNLGERKYFQDLSTENLLRYIPDLTDCNLPANSGSTRIPDGDSLKGYVMEAVTSWTTGKKELIIAMEKTQDVSPSATKYVAISIPASKLNNAILRPGFGFVVFDADGNTWFSSNPQRAGSENFLKEIDSQDVMSAVIGNQEIVTRTEYWENRIRLHVKPSTQLPLYIGTYYELSHSRSFIAEISTMSLFFVLISTFLTGVMALLTNILKNHYRDEKSKRFAFDWIRPRLNRKNYGIYTLSLLNMVFIGILFFIMAGDCVQDPASIWGKSASLISLGLITPCLVYFSNYWIRESIHNKDDFDKVWIGKFLFGNQERLFILLSQLGLFGFCFWFFSYYLEVRSIFLEYVGLGFLILLIMLLISKGIILKRKNSKNEEAASEQETSKENVAKEPETSKENVAKEPETSKENDEKELENNSENQDKKSKIYYRWFIWYIVAWLSVSLLLPLLLVFSLSKNTEEILYYKYEALKVAAIMDDLLASKKSTEKLAKEYFIPGDSLPYMDKYKFDFEKYPCEIRQIKSKRNWSLIAEENWEDLLVRLRPVFPEMLEGLSVTIRDGDILDRWHSEFNESGNLSICYRTKTFPDTVIDINASLHINMKAKPIAHGLSVAEDNILTRPFFICSLIIFVFLLARIIRYTIRTIFGLEFKTRGNVEMNWDEFKECLDTHSDRIIVCSSERAKGLVRKNINCYSFIDIQEFYRQLCLKKEKLEEQLSMIDARFADYPKPKLVLTDKYPSYFLAEAEEDDILDESIIKALQQVLYGMDQLLFNEGLQESRVLGNVPDIFEKKNKNYSYYEQLWSSSCEREKYILYDLAKDGIANTKDEDTVYNLCIKRYLSWNDEKERLEICDKGFRLYIRTIVRNKEGAKIDREKRNKGTWSYLKYIIIGIIVTVFAFVIVGNPDFFKDFNALIAIVASVGTLYPLIGNLFTEKSDSAEATD